MIAMALSGASNFFLPGSEILQEGLDPLMHKVWALTLMLSSLLVMVAAFWRDRITGLLMERAGLFTLGTITPAYIIIVTTLLSFSSGAIGIALTGSIGIASLWRVRHINKELKTLRIMIARDFE